MNNEDLAEVLRLTTLRGALLTFDALGLDPTHRKILLIKIVRDADDRTGLGVLTLREYKLLVERYIGI
jgi:hypothetical protein